VTDVNRSLKLINRILLYRKLCKHTVVGLASWFASFVAWTKLLNVEPGESWDGWQSLGGYTTLVCNQSN